MAHLSLFKELSTLSRLTGIDKKTEWEYNKKCNKLSFATGEAKTKTKWKA